MADEDQTEDEPRRHDVTATLAKLFADHGVPIAADGAMLSLPRGVRAAANVFFLHAHAAQLDVLLELWPGTIVHESCAGFGATEEAQIADAWTSFAAGTLHVLLAAFLYQETDEVERQAWDVDGTTRAITLGPVISRGLPLDTGGWEAAVRAMIEDSTLPEGTHWIRAYAAIEGNRVVASEVLLDNAPWEWGQEQLASFAWPPVESRASARVFLVVQGGLDVGRAVADLIRGVELDDDAIEETMVARGVDRDDAGLLTALVPLAFGRRLLDLAGVGFAVSDQAVVVEGPDRAERTFVLADHPIYAEAAWLAEEGTFDRDQFLAVARRSAEVKAVEHLAEQGHDPSRLGMTPIRIERP